MIVNKLEKYLQEVLSNMKTRLLVEQHFHGCYGVDFSVANVDEVFAKEERELIEDYKEELKLPDYEVQNMSYEDITNPAKRGVTWTNRNDENLRKRFQLDQYEFQSIGENIKWNGMRIADKLWVKIGKPVYNGLNDIIELIADNNCGYKDFYFLF